MRYVDEFRDPELGRVLAGEILSLVDPGRHYKVMEVCGGHTHSIYKYGIDDLLPDNVELVHGPGCPVCVIPMGRVDDGIALAKLPGVIFTCFGDMMRVPGSKGSLLDAKAEGADVRMVYSPLDALRLAKRNPDREVIFFAKQGGKTCGLVVEREAGSSLYANVDDRLLSTDFTRLPPEMIMSSVALSMTDSLFNDLS